MEIEIYDLDKKEKIADFEDLIILNASRFRLFILNIQKLNKYICYMTNI